MRQAFGRPADESKTTLLDCAHELSNSTGNDSSIDEDVEIGRDGW